VLDDKAHQYSIAKNMVGEFLPITPGRFKVLKNARGTRITGYRVSYENGEQVTYTPEQVVHFRRSSIIDPLIGIGLISQARLTVESEAVSMEYQNNFYESDGTPNMVYMDKNEMSPENATLKAKQLRSDYKSGKMDKSLLYTYGNVDVKTLSVSSSDLQFIDNRKLNQQQIISIMESTGSVLGIPDANNRASADKLTNNYFGIVNSRIEHLVRMFNVQFVRPRQEGIYLAYNRYATGDVEEVIKELEGGLLTPAEASKKLGLPYNEADKGQITRFIKKTLIPLETALQTQAGFALSESESQVKKNLIY
jgi:HK97 family phage portal protein